MPAPLRTFMVVLWVLSIAGAVVVAALSLGWVGWWPFIVAGVVGLVLGVPAGIWSARRIKREDPNWPPERRRS
ncbi:MAG: hypothetical protein R3E44_12270 [Paracoccaceae bacterium]